MAIPEHTIKRIHEQADILDIVGRYVQLERRGDRYWGCCPFHIEKTPSFTVSPSRQSFYCFGCKKGGSVFNFLMEIEKSSFIEVVRTLANQMGITIEETGEFNSQEGQEKKALTLLYQRIFKTFEHYLWNSSSGAQALAYLQNRGLDEATMKHFSLGFLPKEVSLHEFLTKKGYSAELLKKSGLFSRNYEKYALFSGRILFPLFNSIGEVIAFSGRILHADPSGKSPKYLNSPDTLIYNKRNHLYGFFQAKKKLDAGFFLCEGAMDVCAMFALGYQTALASLGTALTKEQVKLLARHTEHGYIVYDNDEAGMRAKKSAILLFEEAQLRVKVVNLEEEKDPGEILEKKNLKGLQKIIDNARIPIDFLVDEAMTSFPDAAVGAAFDVCKRVFPFVQSISSPVLQDHVLTRLARRVNLKEGVVFEEFKRFASKKIDSPHVGESERGVADLHSAKFYHFHGTVYELLKIFLDYPDAYRAYSQEIQSVWLDTHESQIVTDYLRADEKTDGAFALWLERQTSLDPHLRAYLSEPTQLGEADWKKRIPILLIALEIRRLEQECRNLSQMITRAEERNDERESVNDLIREYVLVAQELQELKAGLKN